MLNFFHKLPAIGRGYFLGRWFGISATPVLLGIGMTAGLALSEPAQAQGKSASSGIEEVVVTARRKEESLQEVPIAVTAFSDEFLKEHSIMELDDIRTQTPSLGVSPVGTSSNTPVVSLRGQRPSEVLITLDPAVPLYFADIPLTPTHGTNLSMYDLGNVQVLKGPQGTLFGKNSTGGAVLFSPKKPGTEFGGYIDTKIGNYDLGSIEFGVDVPVNDRLRLRLAGKKLDRNGYQENVADNAYKGMDYWDEHSDGLRLTVDFDVTEKLNNMLMVDWGENNMRSRVPTPVAYNTSPDAGENSESPGVCPYCDKWSILYNTSRIAGAPNFGLIYDEIARARNRSDWTDVETDYDAREFVKNVLVSNTTTFEISDSLSIKNIFGYRRLEHWAQFDTDGTAIPFLGSWTAGGPYAATIDLLTGKNDFDPKVIDSEQFSNELEIIGSAFDDRLDWIIGGFWMQTEAFEDSPVQLQAAPSEHRRERGEAYNRSLAIFGEGTFQFNELFALTVGVRQTWDKREMTVNHQGGLPEHCRLEVIDPVLTELLGFPFYMGLPDDACHLKALEYFDSPTGRIIGTFTPQDGKMFYISIASGYRTGGFNLRGYNDATLQPFDEEKVITHEVGAKLDFEFDSGLMIRTNFALYHQEYDDIQKTQSCGSCIGFATETINASKAIIEGGELEVSIIPFEGLEFSIGYSYVDPSYDTWEVGGADWSTRDFTYIPMHSGTASVKYTLPLNADFGEIFVMASYYAQSSMLLDDKATGYDITWTGLVPGTEPAVNNDWLNDAMRADNYEVWDYRIDWRNVMLSDFDFAVWMKNAKDEKYVTGGLNVVGSLGYAAEIYGPPRTVGASLTYNF